LRSARLQSLAAKESGCAEPWAALGCARREACCGSWCTSAAVSRTGCSATCP